MAIKSFNPYSPSKVDTVMKRLEGEYGLKLLIAI